VPYLREADTVAAGARPPDRPNRGQGRTLRAVRRPPLGGGRPVLL